MKAVEYFLNDPWLEPYYGILRNRHRAYEQKLSKITEGKSLLSFASGHHYYGMHTDNNSLVFREWAPNATSIYLIGSFNNWEEKQEFALSRLNREGDWGIVLPGDTIRHGDLYKLSIHWDGSSGERIPSYATSLIQDEVTKIFSCRHWQPPVKFKMEAQ